MRKRHRRPAALFLGATLAFGAPAQAQPAPSSSSAPARPSGPAHVTGVALGTRSGCALLAGGAVKCWGYGFDRGGADATTTIAGFGGKVARLYAGGDQFCALLEVGELRCWSDSDFGPRIIPDLAQVTQVSIGNSTLCAIAAGAVKCWALPVAGPPLQIGGLASGMRAISMGSTYACAIDAAGAVFCWGAFGAASAGTDGPVPIPGVTGASTVSTSYAAACALADGKIMCWSATSPPAEFKGFAGKVVALDGTTAQDGLCVVTADGAAQCAGNNFFGRLGHPDGKDLRVTGLSGVKAVALGGKFGCAIAAGDRLLCWGDNADDELAVGRAHAASPAPIPVTEL